MSRKNSLNKQNQQHRKQPIHLYPFSKGSLGDIRNVYSPIEFMTLPNSYVSSPLINNLQKLSPSSISPKYARLSSKIELLQKNLNRLNGQHESLKDMFTRSQQLTKCLQVYSNLQKLKIKIQQSKTNKYIQQKRYQARFQIVYEDYIKKLSQFKKQSLHPQCQQLKNLQNGIMKSKENGELAKFYSDSFEMVKKNIMSIDENATRFLNQVQENLRKESIQLINKKEVQDIINQEKQKISQKAKNIRVKFGELKCIAEYEMHLERERFLGKNRPQLNNSINKQKSISQQQSLHRLELEAMKEQTDFVGLQSLDRLTYQLITIDSNLVQILQQYESGKQNFSIKKSQQSTGNKQDSKSQFQFKVSSIHKSITDFNHEFTGLKSFMKSSDKKLQWMKQKYNQQNLNNTLKINIEDGFQTQNVEIMESIIDLEEKISLLEKNLNFLRINCL